MPKTPLLFSLLVEVASAVSALPALSQDSRAASRPIVIEGRLVDTRGRPAKRAKLEIWLSGLPRDSSKPALPDGRGTSNSDGEFEIGSDRDPSVLTSNDLRLRVHLDAIGLEMPPYGKQTLDLSAPASLREGHANLGDVTVQESPLVATGKLARDDGRRVIEGGLALLEQGEAGWQPHEVSRDVNFSLSYSGDFYLRANAFQLHFEKEVDEHGQPRSPYVLALWGMRRGMACIAPVPVTPGATDVRVVMTTAGSLEGTLAGVAARLDPPAIRIRVNQTAGEHQLPAGSPKYVWRERRRFGAERLLPGTWSVEMLSAGDQQQLLVVNDVEVAPGEVTRDPRLRDIDLDKLLTMRSVSVSDLRRDPVKGARIGVRGAAGRGHFATAITDESGKAIVATPQLVVEVVVAAKGFLPVSTISMFGDASVRLEPATPLKVPLRLAETISIPTAPFAIAAELSWLRGVADRPDRIADPTDPRRAADALESVRFRRDYSTTAVVPAPGVYVVNLWAIEDDKDGAQRTRLPQIDGNAIITVTSPTTPTTILNVDPAALALAIKRLR